MNLRGLLIAILILIVSCKPSKNQNIDAQNIKPLIEIINEQGLKKEQLSLLIDKSDYTLSVVIKDQVIKTYPMVLGTNPVDDKRMEGDRSTPEGIFKVRDFYPHAQWSKFIWIDYPTQESWNKHNAAKLAGKIPQDATIGGEVGIHGVPKGKDYLINEKVNWTWGCISLSNQNVNDLYTAIYKDMIIKITP